MTLISVGKVTSPFGNKGEVKVIPLTDWLCRFLTVERVCTVKDGEQKGVLQVENVRYHSGRIILKLSGVDSIEQANRLREVDLAVPEEELVALPPGHFWIHQVEGLRVVDEAGTHLGTVTKVLQTRANDVYVLEAPGGQALIPATHEVVKSIDVAGGVMVIRPLPGLLG